MNSWLNETQPALRLKDRIRFPIAGAANYLYRIAGEAAPLFLSMRHDVLFQARDESQLGASPSETHEWNGRNAPGGAGVGIFFVVGVAVTSARERDVRAQERFHVCLA